MKIRVERNHYCLKLTQFFCFFFLLFFRMRDNMETLTEHRTLYTMNIFVDKTCAGSDGDDGVYIYTYYCSLVYFAIKLR